MIMPGRICVAGIAIKNELLASQRIADSSGLGPLPIVAERANDGAQGSRANTINQRAEQAAEKLNSLKGTGFSPYISPLKSTRLQPPRDGFRGFRTNSALFPQPLKARPIACVPLHSANGNRPGESPSSTKQPSCPCAKLKSFLRTSDHR